MKKSDRNLLQERLRQLAQPSPTSEPKPDVTDEIGALYGGNMQLPGSLPALLQGNQSRPDETPVMSVSTLSTPTTQGSQPTHGRKTAQSRRTARGTRSARSSAPVQGDVSPQRDYMKTANSIIRDALRNGLFRGKSKQLYDFLYSKTRGAIVPSKSTQLTRAELMRGSHIGSTHTLRDNLRHLQAVGLVNWTEKSGEQTGNVYTIFLPNEVDLPFDLDGNPMQLNCPDHPDHSGQNLPRPPSAESAQPAQGSSQVDATISGEPQTSFKTNTEIDDELQALSDASKVFNDVSVRLTGKPLNMAERGRWKEVAEVLTTELQIAAARTGSVSSVPAFLAEHLRRRLFKKDQKQLASEASQTMPAHEPALTPEQIKNCPDCGGSGMYYPEGYEKGVAKCRHANLEKRSTNTLEQVEN
jgi:hypothetical protein